MRRGGQFANARNGKIDFNGKLADPLISAIAVAWEALFSRDAIAAVQCVLSTPDCTARRPSVLPLLMHSSHGAIASHFAGVHAAHTLRRLALCTLIRGVSLTASLPGGAWRRCTMFWLVF